MLREKGRVDVQQGWVNDGAVATKMFGCTWEVRLGHNDFGCTEVAKRHKRVVCQLKKMIAKGRKLTNPKTSKPRADGENNERN
ncbi:hypothetical protein L1987_23069 [Smallanthus sonchifolius]|uniref:Uncharacterized protein n=1 Tax=Smallanthus sonchifolius TaxID=185202 RepID=A0ACB9II30_9ASTR|nr:hypothetical protein L1987_23069 [Smallanthus sonchifolius]